MSVFASLSMFFLSFAPLWISILFLDIKSIIENETPLCTEWISICVIAGASLLSVIILFCSLRVKNRAGIQKYRLTHVEEQKSITAEYLLSYILPLFAFDFTLWDQVVLFLVYFLTLGYLCIKHNQLSVNIVLELFHYRFYLCEMKNEDQIPVTKYIISREKLINHKNHIISTRPLNNEYSLDLLDW